MATCPHPIPYQGSKRRLAAQVLAFVPNDVDTLWEPCCGSAAVSLAAAREQRARRFVLGDSLAPLCSLWQRILDEPGALADEYQRLWSAQREAPRAWYDEVREAFNADHDPAKLLFLLARCVKSAVRFNAAGAFNQSPDRRRRGTRPERMREHLLGASALLAGRTEVRAGDYAHALDEATAGDLVYLDPPWQGTSGARDRRYHQQHERERFVADLERLLARGVRVVVSYDGRTGDRRYGEPLPERLGLVRRELFAGRSTQATLHGRSSETVESLYLSPSLVGAG
ncbi:MAG: DNA adenine methylase [Deltaproteobacteria bacterium]|nr:DNA adenine methylase [Deltaproteobacteria bacterium]